MIVVSIGMLIILIGILFFLFLHIKSYSSVWMKQEIEALRGDFKESLNHLITQINERLRDNTSVLDSRLDNTAKIVSSVSEHLGRLHEASTKIFEVGKDISSLQELLQAPKIRGGLGEFFLADLLSQVMPKEFYQMPYLFKNGQQVDAAIRLGAGLVPVDSKFPLENFKAMAASQTEDKKKSSRRQFISDVKKHIADIAAKYILPDEGTFDFALMYIPAENIYYETIIKDERFGDEAGLFQYSLNKKVIPVSPNSFYAYLQVIILGLKGMTVEKGAKIILSNLERLKGDFEKFYEEFAKLGRHLANSTGTFGEAEKRLLKLQEKVLQISGLSEEKKLDYE